MGERGPAPKRAAERRRNNKPDIPTKTLKTFGRVAVPAASKDWHEVAKRLYLSLRHSGQSQFYEPSDWAAAYLLCESLSRDLEPQIVEVVVVEGERKAMRATVPLKGASIAAYLKGFAALGVSEGDRRRIGIEIERQERPALASVSAMDEYRDALGG